MDMYLVYGYASDWYPWALFSTLDAAVDFIKASSPPYCDELSVMQIRVDAQYPVKKIVYPNK